MVYEWFVCRKLLIALSLCFDHLDVEQKNRNYEKWMENEIPVLVALTPKQIYM